MPLHARDLHLPGPGSKLDDYVEFLIACRKEYHIIELRLILSELPAELAFSLKVKQQRLLTAMQETAETVKLIEEHLLSAPQSADLIPYDPQRFWRMYEPYTNTDGAVAVANRQELARYVQHRCTRAEVPADGSCMIHAILKSLDHLDYDTFGMEPANVRATITYVLAKNLDELDVDRTNFRAELADVMANIIAYINDIPAAQKKRQPYATFLATPEVKEFLAERRPSKDQYRAVIKAYMQLLGDTSAWLGEDALPLLAIALNSVIVVGEQIDGTYYTRVYVPQQHANQPSSLGFPHIAIEFDRRAKHYSAKLLTMPRAVSPMEPEAEPDISEPEAEPEVVKDLASSATFTVLKEAAYSKVKRSFRRPRLLQRQRRRRSAVSTQSTTSSNPRFYRDLSGVVGQFFRGIGVTKGQANWGTEQSFRSVEDRFLQVQIQKQVDRTLDDFRDTVDPAKQVQEPVLEFVLDTLTINQVLDGNHDWEVLSYFIENNSEVYAAYVYLVPPKEELDVQAEVSKVFEMLADEDPRTNRKAQAILHAATEAMLKDLMAHNSKKFAKGPVKPDRSPML